MEVVMTALVGVLIPKRTYRDSKSSFDISDCLITAGARHCCRQLGLRREVRPRKEVLRQAHQRAIRDTGVLEFFFCDLPFSCWSSIALPLLRCFFCNTGVCGLVTSKIKNVHACSTAKRCAPHPNALLSTTTPGWVHGSIRSLPTDPL